jgi:hypothetical protein
MRPFVPERPARAVADVLRRRLRAMPKRREAPRLSRAMTGEIGDRDVRFEEATMLHVPRPPV